MKWSPIFLMCSLGSGGVRVDTIFELELPALATLESPDMIIDENASGLLTSFFSGW